MKDFNKQFGIAGTVNFKEGKGGLPFVELTNQLGKAIISLYGAHVLSYIPNGHEDVLWCSENSLYSEGKAIRGGIPLCFPWFGPHPSDNSKAQHGFARLSNWTVLETAKLQNESVVLRLGLTHSEATQAIWPYAFSAVLEVVLGAELKVSLTITNTDRQTFTYTDALHSYLHVGNIEQISIEGLHQAKYYKGFDKDNTYLQNEELLKIEGEENRRYVETEATTVIHDSSLNRKIQIAKEGSRTTVVWNPWSETVKTMNDMTPDSYRSMMCIEAANAYADFVELEPGQSHTLSTSISIIA
jgi:glucose-6-phosphate 1-epimerase